MNLKKYFSEFLGTFLLVFLGTGSIIVSEEFKGSLNTFTIALLFGIIVGFLIYFFGKFSDSYINPCVTLTFMINNKLALKQGIGYIILQVAGALFASFSLKGIFPNNANLGNTLPSIPIAYAFALEFIMSGILILGILYTTKHAPNFTYLIIGFIVFIEAWLGGPYTGASMNMARTIGPSVASGNCNYLWLYVTAPTAGMITFYMLLKKINKELINNNK
jgi:aquaporin NIP